MNIDIETYQDLLKRLLIQGEQALLIGLQVVAILAGGMFVARALKRQAEKVLANVIHLDETFVQFLSGLVNYSVMVLAIVAALGKCGVPTTSILTALGAAGLAVGLALQGTLANIAAGLMILILRPFKIGEYIEAGSCAGTVELIGLFSTQLSDIDGLYLMAPNSQIWSQPIKNYSRNNKRRIVVSLGVAYGSNPKKSQDLILEFLNSSDEVLNDPAPQVLVDQLGESSVDLKVRFWVSSVDYINFKSSATSELKSLLEKNDIEIPFPQRELLIKNSEQSSK